MTPSTAAQPAESSALLGDPPALRARFEADGYLFFRGLVDRAAAVGLGDRVLRAVAPHGWLAAGSDPRDAQPGPVRVEGDPGWWEGYTAIQSVEQFHALAHHDALLDLARALAGAEVIALPRKVGRVTYPHSEFPTPPHQDFPLFQGCADTYTAWLPLRDCTAAMGALRVSRGSHRGHLRLAVPHHGVGGLGVAGAVDETSWVSTDYRAGDVLLFHSFTVHQAPPNRGERLRVSVDYRYQAADDPLDEWSALPHGHPDVPGWEVVTAGWDSRRWIELPASARRTPFRDALSDLGRPPSRHVAAPG